MQRLLIHTICGGLWLLCGLPISFAQSYRIEGNVQDTLAQPLSGASIMILQAEDSILQGFGLTNEKGFYRVPDVPQGDYLIQYSYFGYAPEWKKVSVSGANKVQVLPVVMLRSEILTLNEVEIEAQQAPVALKKDTIEYNAGAFQPQAGEVVEDLLNRLPGVEVDAQGNVKAQGENVRKVLVDGKEFFGNDPKVATKNLPADAIKKVQVYDEKTDEEDFTGVDDGQRQQTINLELKEDRKKGGFGSFALGGGTDSRFQAKLNLNRFAPGIQYSVLGMGNNLNDQDFSFDEYLDFMGGIGNLMEGGVIRLEIDDAVGAAVPFGASIGDGITTGGSGGMNTNIDLGKKTTLNLNYYTRGAVKELEQETYREQYLEEASFVSEEFLDREDQYWNHQFKSFLRYRGDSLSRLSLRVNLGWNQGGFVSASEQIRRNAEAELASVNLRNQSQDTRQMKGSTNLTYLKRLGKKGRTLSLSGKVEGEMKNLDGNLLSSLSLQGLGNDSLDQFQVQANNQFAYNAQVTYTEPLGKGHLLKVNYTYQNYQDLLDREVWDRLPFETRNAQLSNQYERGFQYQRAGVTFSRSRDKFTLSLGADVQDAVLAGNLISLGDTLRDRYFNLLPRLQAAYSFTNGKRLSFRYNTRIRAPRPDQLQPVADNRDPLNIYIGNPALRLTYTHRMNTTLMWIDQFNFITIFANLSAQYNQNPIVEARSVDSLLRQVRTPVNTADSWNTSFFLTLNTPLPFVKAKLNVEGMSRYNQAYTFINDLERQVNRWTHTGDFSIENQKKKVWDGRMGVRLSYNRSIFPEVANLNRSYLNQEYYANFRINLGENWVIRGDANWMVYGGDAFDERQEVMRLGAGIERFFAKKKMSLSLTGFDLLNQNVGFQRTAEVGYLEENQVLTLRRYVLLTFSYRINKGGEDSGNVTIRKN
ncbi:MAG: outer membrane beta-barrel family protein [Bacteroidota bacterium]